MWIDHLATCPRERAPRNPVRKKPELTAICLCALLAASSAAQGANLVWSVEATDIPPLPAVRLWLNCLNPTSTSISWEFAARIEGRLTAKLKREYPCHCGSPNCRGTLLAPKRR